MIPEQDKIFMSISSGYLKKQLKGAVPEIATNIYYTKVTGKRK